MYAGYSQDGPIYALSQDLRLSQKRSILGRVGGQ